MKLPLCALSLVLAIVPALHAQDTSKLVYDVSTVKPHDPADGSVRWSTPNGRLEVRGGNLKALIASAWGLRPDQVTGESPWVDAERWDVTGKATDAEEAVLRKMTKTDRERMTQTLLAERFHVKAHLETRIGSVFTLTLAKGGLKIKEVPAPAPTGWLGEKHVPEGGLSLSGTNATSTLTAHAISIETLAANIAGNTNQTVIDRTGISPDARFDFKLRWAYDNGMGPSAQADAPPMPEALEQQLGLHLRATRGPVQVVVVDHAERPTAN